MNKVLQGVLFLKSFSALVRDPQKTENVFRLADIVSAENTELVREVGKYMSQFPSFGRLYDEKYVPPMPDLDSLSRLPASTLGGAYARHMRANNLKAEFFPHTQTLSKRDYYVERARRTHDVWHVLTNLDTSVSGEIGLQAFALAQTRSPLSALIVAGGILHTLIFNKAIYSETIDKIFAGYQLGKQAEFLLGVKFEDRWSDDLEKLKKELRLA
jgi:ubiquinone biosynthesis protein COQ4